MGLGVFGMALLSMMDFDEGRYGESGMVGIGGKPKHKLIHLSMILFYSRADNLGLAYYFDAPWCFCLVYIHIVTFMRQFLS